MLDYEALIEECDKSICYILDNLGIEYVFENDWVCIRCCFHNGNKFNLKYRDKSFYCFSECRRGYSIVQIVAKILVVSYEEAGRWLANLLNIDCTTIEQTKDVLAFRDSVHLLKKCKKIKAKGQIEYKPVSQIVLNDIEPCYCKEISNWGITEKTAREFNIGFARCGELDSRITFPIDAPDGTIVTISGRMPNAEEYGLQKYHILNGTDARVTLYNISRATKYAKELGYIFVVEGMKSVMKMWQWGYRNCVAVLGASLADTQTKLLLKLGVTVYVIGDNDKAGRTLMQSVYNQLYQFIEVIQVDIDKVTNVEKDGVADLKRKQFEELIAGYGLVEEDLDF